VNRQNDVSSSSKASFFMRFVGHQSLNAVQLHLIPIMCIIPFGSSQDIEDEIEDDFLAEILAEEQKEAEELSRLEAEMRELDELKAQHQKMQEEEYANKMKPGQKGKGNENLNNVEEELRRKEADADTEDAQRTEEKSAEDEEAKKKAEEIANKREAEYLAELEQIKDEKARKMLKRQKRRDSQIVKRVLRNSENERHYSVLGLKCKWGEIRIGPLSFCKTPSGEIKRAYRKMARLVHPDKNRDGRAGQAFDALENSAALLMDPTKKKFYDLRLTLQREEAFAKAIAMIQNAWLSIRTVFRLLGPFAPPILILLALII